VTSVSVIMNGNEEPQFTDAVGKTVPRPFVPPQVASPINLLNPDRYEFYTFNEKGELVKRLMTLREIQSIVANGNGALIGGDNDPNESQSVILNSIPLTNSNHDSDTKVQDIVDTVQNVLSREMENNKNISTIPHELLDTPNVSSSWSMILPAIFGNTGDDILPQVPINMTPEAEVIDTTTTKRSTSTRRPISKKPSSTVTKKVSTTRTTAAPKKQTTKLEQKIVPSTTVPSTTKRTTLLTKKPITSSTTKKQTVKTKPTNLAFRSTTRRPIVSIINNIPSIKDDSYHVDETTKTVLITSRPQYTAASTSSKSTTRSPVTRTTTKKIIRKPTVSNVRKNSTTSSILHKVPASSLIKDSQITKIEMKPVMVELKNEENKNKTESNFEKTTQAPSTILSTLSISSSTTQRPTMMEVVKIETLAPPTKIFTKPSSTTILLTTESEAPSSPPTVVFSSSRPITTEKEKLTTMSLMPIKLETFTTTEKPKIPETTVMEMINEETTSVELPSSEEIRQDLAINQIIGSLQNNNFNLNHLFKPFDNDIKEAPTTMASTHVEESTTKMQIIEQDSDSINHVPDKEFIDNQLHLDEKEPIVKDISTTEAPVIDEMTTIENEPTFEKITTTVKSKEDSIPLLENSEVMQTIEKLLLEQNKSKNKVNADKLDILGFDDDDETEIQLENEFNTKKPTKTTKAPLVFTKITQRTTEMPPSTTTAMANEESETTISTILSEALSNVIEQMIKEQEFRKTSTISTELPQTTTKPIMRPSTFSTSKAPITKASTELPQTTSKTTPEAIEPSLDELNKLLYHYQDLSSIPNELESLSLVKEDSITTTESPMFEALETSTVKKVHPIIEEKSSSSLHHDKIYSEIDSTTVTSILDDEEETTTVTEDPTTQEFTTFFYVSDSSVEEITDDNLGEFTTEQFVTSEKRISERKNEALTTTSFPPLTDSDEDNDTDEEEEVEMPADLVSNVFDAIGLSSNSDEDGEDENTSTEKILKPNVNDAPSESEESDEIVSTISKISSTLDKTIQTDINTDFSLTSNIANSLISVADSLSDTLNDDTESDETTDTILRTTVIPKEPESTSTQKAITEQHEDEENLPVRENEYLIELSSEAFQDTTMEESQEEMTTEKIDEVVLSTTLETTVSDEDLPTTTAYQIPIVTKKLPKFPIIKNNNKHKENGIQLAKDDSSPMVQLSIIRKEDSLEEINIMTPAIPTSTKIPITEGNFIKIESIDMSTKKMSTTSSPNLNDTKNNKTYENVKPISIAQRATTTAKSSSLPDIVPSQATKVLIEKHESNAEKTDEPLTERVPLIEKATKEIMESAPMMMMASDENLVQIQVQTKPPTTIYSSSSAKTPLEFKTTLSTAANMQNIKNSIKNAQQFQVHTRVPIIQTIDLSSSPKENLGLAASTANLNSDLSDFSKLCNELAFTFWKSITADGISQSRSVVISPFALTSTLSMIFLGARGQTSGEMNDLLRLDDTVTFNPHVVFRNISESVEQSRNSGIAAAAFARELYSDRSKGKLLPYFKEKAQQFYGAHVEEVNFNVVNDILRRRTNLLVKKHTYNKIKEYLKTNNIWVNEPLAAVSANIFMVCANLTEFFN